MDSLKRSIFELTEHFNSRMADFQKDLKEASPTSSPSNINVQFNTFRAFVLSALESLQSQVELLSRQQDEFETRSRRKILLLHGVPEEKKEDISACVTKLLSHHLKLTTLTTECYTRCHRLGSRAGNKPRAILVRFKESSLRDKIWSSKSSLKGTGRTLSEFLTKSRHEAFVQARKLFGIKKCWTKDGCIVVLGADGAQRRVVSVSEVNAMRQSSAPVTSVDLATASVSGPVGKESKASSNILRSKRVVKK